MKRFIVAVVAVWASVSSSVRGEHVARMFFTAVDGSCPVGIRQYEDTVPWVPALSAAPGQQVKFNIWIRPGDPGDGTNPAQLEEYVGVAYSIASPNPTGVANIQSTVLTPGNSQLGNRW